MARLTMSGKLSNGNGKNGEEGYKMQPAEELLLTSKCQHYTEKQEVPWELQKYWSQRYSLFTAYDEGIYLTDDAWFGVTPEPVAQQIAYDISETPVAKTTIIDAFAGVGGNSIAFALSERWARVIAVERDVDTLACAQINASIYGITDQITWVLADSFEYVRLALEEPGKLHPDLRIEPAETIMFASPPWGGPGYRTDEVFNLHKMEPYSLLQLHDAYKTMDHALYLPRTSDVRQIARLIPDEKKVEVVQYCVEGASKAMVAYIPAIDPSRQNFFD